MMDDIASTPGQQPVRLQVGLSCKTLPGYYVCDHRLLTEPGMPNGFADEILALDCLERMSFQEAAEAIESWHRVLKPGGRLKVTVPDVQVALEAFVTASADTVTEVGAAVQAIYGSTSDEDRVCKSGYTRESLTELLANAGFLNCRELEIRDDAIESGRLLTMEAHRASADELRASSCLRTSPDVVRLKIGLLQAAGGDNRSYGIPHGLGHLAAYLDRELAGRVEVQVYSDLNEALRERPPVVGISSVSSCFNDAKHIAVGLMSAFK